MSPASRIASPVACLLPFALVLAACGKAPDGQPPPHPLDQGARASPSGARSRVAASTATMMAELRHQLVGTATLDGATITDLRSAGNCRTTIVTANGDTPIEWAKAGNIAPHDKAGREINDVPGADGPHALSMPVGAAADGVSGTIGLLASECER